MRSTKSSTQAGPDVTVDRIAEALTQVGQMTIVVIPEALLVRDPYDHENGWMPEDEDVTYLF